MGLIEFGKENEEIKKSGKYLLSKNQIKKIDVTNWRCIIDYPKNQKLEIITEKYERFLVEDVTLTEFHEINYCNKTVTKLFQLNRLHLPCILCNGKGKIDWVAKIIRTSKPMPLNKSFDRNTEGPILILTRSDINQPGIVYVSTPKIISGEEICSFCHGSGLNFVNNFKVYKKL